MKDLFIAAILIFPCLLVFNESYTIIPNLIGLSYIVMLVILSNTEKGKEFVKRIDKLLNN